MDTVNNGPQYQDSMPKSRKRFKPTKSTHSDQFQLQKDLKVLESWSSLWCMQFNASKCHVMLVNKGRSYIPFQYQLCETVLRSVSHEKYLGVELSKDMSLPPHIRSITAKAHQKLGFLRRNLRGSHIECKRLA